jgi:hypothetical protein
MHAKEFVLSDDREEDLVDWLALNAKQVAQVKELLFVSS